MAKRHLVKLGWESDSQSSKKLGTSGLDALVKPSDISLELSGGAHAPSYCNVDIVLRIVLPAKRTEAAATIAEQKTALLGVQVSICLSACCFVIAFGIAHLAMGHGVVPAP